MDMNVKPLEVKILEMFRSIQGEGMYCGVMQVFVRFFECNMHCVWCDTPHSIGDTSRRYQNFGIDALINNICELYQQCHSVTITGGEPLMQADVLKEVLPKLRAKQMPIHLETNGTLPQALATVIDQVDVVAMDLKLPSSTQAGVFWEAHEQFFRVARQHDELFVKTVISLETSFEDWQKAIQLLVTEAKDRVLIIQPNSFQIKDGVMDVCLKYFAYAAKHLKFVRVIPQVHRFLKVR